MKFLFYIYISLFSVFSITDINEIEKSIAAAFKKGDVKSISRHFTSSVKVSIDRNEQIATKSQAEMIISEYLNDNKFTEVGQRQNSKNSNSNYLLLDAKSAKKNVKIFVKLVKIRDSEFIAELRID